MSSAESFYIGEYLVHLKPQTIVKLHRLSGSNDPGENEKFLGLFLDEVIGNMNVEAVLNAAKKRR